VSRSTLAPLLLRALSMASSSNGRAAARSQTASRGAPARRTIAFERLAQVAARWSASSVGFTTALAIVLVWLATGPFLHYSTTWQLVINTGTTIITFLMVFLIQRSQSKDALAIQLKLDELVAALAGANNRLVAAEDLSEADLEDLHRRYRVLSERARHLRDKQASLSLEELEGKPRNGKKPNHQGSRSKTNGTAR
jgi:low affinity Fe/Cu permease